MMWSAWKINEIAFLTENYPVNGKQFCMKALNRSEGSIRWKAFNLRLVFIEDLNSEHSIRRRAKIGDYHRGRKRPKQALVISVLHAAGKLKKTPEQNKAMGERQRLWIRNNGHPRGALGMKHTKETLAILSEKSKNGWKRMTAKRRQERMMKMQKTKVANGTQVNERQKTTWKGGWRQIGAIRKYYRSRWEANYARILQFHLEQAVVKSWLHEPETFWFEGVKRGCVSYLPDFRIEMHDGTIEYHEVKGWMDARSKTKIKRMAKYHPGIKLLVIDAKEYRKLERVYGFLPEWE